MTLWPAVRQEGGESWRLLEEMDVGGVSVPEGTTFRPSIPRLLWPLVSPLETLTASAVHDYMYRHRLRSRKEADQLFVEVMRQQGQTWWRRQLAYAAVRAGGWLYWYDWID